MIDELDAGPFGASAIGFPDVGTQAPIRRISLLGELGVTLDGRVAAVTAPKQRAVLAHLALEPGVAQPTGRLLDLVWGDDQPAGGPKAVAFQITKLRGVLEPDRSGEGTLIRTTSGGYVLDMSPREVDLHDAAALVADATAALAEDPVKACALGTDALALWRGEPFGDVATSPVIDDEVRRMELLRLQCRVVVQEARLALGEHHEVLSDLVQIAAENPLDEHIAVLHARALDRCGRTADALRAVGDVRGRLRDELGIDPSPEITELELSLLARDHVPAVAVAPVGGGRGLPTPVTSLVGRDDQADAVVEALQGGECRVLTLVGPGGVGKTRLGLEAATRWANRHDRPAWFCGLAGLAPGASTPDAVADAVGLVVDDHAIAGSGLDNRTQLLDYLGARQGLLVIDNAEHVQDLADLVADIAELCHDVVVLVTSREALSISAEWIEHVDGLSDDSAAQLFVARARQAGARLAATDAEHIERVCHACAGLPLALELGAAMAGAQPVSQVADHLETAATAIASVHLDSEPRHRSLHAAFEHSWDGLDPSLQDTFAALSVFPAPFDAGAAQGVAEAGASTLGRLIMKSLVRRVGPSEFDLHPLIRQFAETKLGDRSEHVGAAHSRYYLDRIERQTAKLLGSPEQGSATAAVDAEIDHIRAGALWLAGRVEDPDADARLAAALHGLSAHGFIRSIVGWSQSLTAVGDTIEATVGPHPERSAAYIWARVYHSYPDAMMEGDGVAELMRRLEPAAAALAPKALAWCLTNQAICAEMAGDVDSALEIMERAAHLDAEGDPLLVAVVTSWHGWELSLSGRHEEANAIWQAGLELVSEAQNQTARGYMLSKVGLAADDLGNHELALRCHHESTRIFEATGDNGGLGYTLSRISWTQRMLGNFDEAIAAADQALERFQIVNHRWGIGASIGRRAHAQLDAGRHADAAAGFGECIDWGQDRSVPPIAWYGLVGVAMTLADLGHDEQAVELHAHSETIGGNPYAAVFARPQLAALEEAMAPTAFQAARQRGHAMSLPQALASARGHALAISG